MLARAVGLLRDHPLLTPLLVVYTALVVTAIALVAGPALLLVDVVLFGIYLAVIHFATSAPPTRIDDIERLPHRSRDFALIVTVAAMQLAAVAIVWFVVVPTGVLGVWIDHLVTAGIPPLLAAKAVNAALALPLLLAPTALAIAAFRVSPKDVGLHAGAQTIGLGLVMAAIGIALGVGAVAAGNHPDLFWQSAAPPVVVGAVLLQLMINGLPEELAFRGVILGRLLVQLERPGNSLAISSIVFGFFHVPSLIAQAHVGSGWTLLADVFGGYGFSGLVFGYLYYRTRSIWPGVIWHTSVSGVGVMGA